MNTKIGDYYLRRIGNDRFIYRVVNFDIASWNKGAVMVIHFVNGKPFSAKDHKEKLREAFLVNKEIFPVVDLSSKFSRFRRLNPLERLALQI